MRRILCSGLLISALAFGGDGNHLESGVPLQLIVPIEVGKLAPARAAPRGPEVNDEHMALVVREADLSTVKRRRLALSQSSRQEASRPVSLVR